MRPARRTLTATLLGSALALTACGSADGTGPATSTGASGAEPLSVVVGFYPYQFVAERVGGDDVDVSNLTAPGAEPHDLELSPQQVAELSEADLVLYSAGFQPAVDEAVEQQAADRSFDVLTAVDLREYGESPLEEAHSDEDDHSDEEEAHSEEGTAHGEEGHGHEGEDPHVWLDPVRMTEVAAAIAAQLSEVAPDRAEAFQERADALTAELEALDGELESGLSSCARTEVVVSHDAFGYLADRYDLQQVAISGLSPEDEPSPRRLAEVAEYAEANGVTTIFFEELVSPRLAESLASEVGARTEVLSPLEGEPEQGDYLDVMRANLGSLRTALDCA